MDNWHFRFRRRGFSLWSIKSGQSGALVVKVSEEDENIRDSAFEGWMANRAEGTTSRKGKGPGKKSGGTVSGGSGSGEDFSWGKEASKLCKEIKKDLMEAGPEEVTKAVAGGSRPVKVGSRYFCPPL